MKHTGLLRSAIPVAMLALAACADPGGDMPQPAETMMPVEPDGGIGDGAGPPDTVDGDETRDDGLTATIPQAVRGEWREDDLGRAPTTEDCNQTSQSNRNFGKVLTVRADGYSLFEESGEITEVHNRTDTMIDATFDVTVGPGTSQARKDIALQPGGSLAVNHDDGDGRLDVVQYRRCPG